MEKSVKRYWDDPKWVRKQIRNIEFDYERNGNYDTVGMFSIYRTLSTLLVNKYNNGKTA